MIENIISERLKLRTVSDKMYDLTGYNIDTIKEFNLFVKRYWNSISEYKQNMIAAILAGNLHGKGKNIQTFNKYIENL